MDLRGKVALITGTKRIGRALAIELAKCGADTALTWRTSREEAEGAAREIEKIGRRAFTLRLDLEDESQITPAVALASSTLGRLDILLNVASMYRKAPASAADAADWDANMNTNARGAFLCARAAVPHMRRLGGGRIINFADWLPLSGRPRYDGYTTYYISKAASVAMTQALALDLAKDGILVNAIAPGPILPHEGITDSENAEVIRNTPLGRWGGEEAIVQAVMALLSCDFVTGEVLRVDGGRHLR